MPSTELLADHLMFLNVLLVQSNNEYLKLKLNWIQIWCPWALPASANNSSRIHWDLLRLLDCWICSWQNSTSNQKLHTKHRVAGLPFNIPLMYILALWNNFLKKTARLKTQAQTLLVSLNALQFCFSSIEPISLERNLKSTHQIAEKKHLTYKLC